MFLLTQFYSVSVSVSVVFSEVILDCIHPSNIGVSLREASAHQNGWVAEGSLRLIEMLS